MDSGPAYYHQSVEEVAKRLGVDPATGLTAADAAKLFASHGPNELPAEKPTPEWKRFVAEYKSYLQIILLGAGIVSLVIAQWGTGVLLLVLTIVNAVVGMREEGKAASAMNALKKMLKTQARVLRDGADAKIDADQLVPGDVVLLSAGDQVPADGRLIAAQALQIDEAAFTGESVPANKVIDPVPDDGTETVPRDQLNMAFMNTPVTHGSGRMIVTATGGDTEIGHISKMLAATAQEATPLTRQLNRMSLWLAVIAGITMVVMFVLGLHRGQEWTSLFVTAVALAIASIPEALPTVVQVILSMGAVDLAKHKAMVKDLSSVETLGSTSAINSDKTGTLTMNQMTVVEVLDATDRFTVTGSGYDLDGAIEHAVGTSPSMGAAILPFLMANDAKIDKDGKVVGDPTEGAMLVLAHKAQISPEATQEKYPRLATLPFDPTYKLMATFNDFTDDAGKKVVRCFVKGAAPAMLGRSKTGESGGEAVPLDDERRKKIGEYVARLEGEGLRVMAGAYRDLDPATFDAAGDLLDYVDDLEMTGLIGMVDPPRAESKAAVAAAQAAHIRVRMVTGDDVITGSAIAKQLGIKGKAVLGADFAQLSEAERLAQIDDIGVVGRVAPEHKVLIAETLKKKGEVVAMTGDGVNDAPAIKAADIGIAMGTGTEVAKSAGRMILEDDNFATIVFAIEQGRKLYDNLTKYVRFILITLVAFVLTFLGASLLNIAAGQPFNPVQILWINFLIDTPLGIALGFDKETPGLMSLVPRRRGASMLTRSMVISVALVGLFMTAWLLFLIQLGIHRYGGAAEGSSLALTAFALFRIVGTYECRSQTRSAVHVDSFDNKWLNRMALVEIVLALLATELGVLQKILGTKPLTIHGWGIAFGAALSLLVVWEIGKALARLAERGREKAPVTAAHAKPAAAGTAPASPA